MNNDTYNKAISVFGSDNKLDRIEKLNKSINDSLPCIGITYDGGTLIISHAWKGESKLMRKSDIKLIFKISDEVACGFAGRTADARKLVEDIQDIAIDDVKKYGGVEDADYIVKKISSNIEDINLEMIYRPVGVSLLVGGYDGRNESCLYCVQTNGNITSWNAYSIGKNSENMNQFLESNYEEDISYSEAFDLAIDCLDEFNDIETSENLQGVSVEEDSFERIPTDEFSNKLNSGDKNE